MGGGVRGLLQGGYCRGEALSIAMAGWLPKTTLSIAMVGRLAASEETPTTGGYPIGTQRNLPREILNESDLEKKHTGACGT